MRPAIFSIVLVSVLSMGMVSQAADRARFSSVIDDLPMMDQMAEVTDGVAFSTPAGRIADTQATTMTSREKVLAFYIATLPQLGWAQTGEATFVREGEMLNLTFEKNGSGQTVRFALVPHKN